MSVSTRVPIRAVILAAGIGSRIRPLTDDRPKSLLEIDGVSILRRMVALLRSCGIRRILVVVGYRQDQVRCHLRECFPDLQIGFVVNELYASTNTAYSRWLARHALLGEELVKLDADVVFERRILDRLLRVPGNAICVDTSIRLAEEEVKVAVEGSGRVLE
ncbi:MAG: phosphocholine cytidylyltransferase family protein, partial [Holophagales bacterium]|nr:phosphocholine cytidylyltransferase family protein [Holophagales bacterium]